MKIGLLGYKFENENLGCVALTYTTLSILKRTVPNDLTVVNITDVHENMVEAQNYFKDITIFEHIYHLRNKLNFLDFKTIKLIKSCDMVLDITYGDNFSDIYLPNFVKRTSNMKLWVEKLGVPLILMPQTIGPFENKKLLKQALKAIENSTRVYSRDLLSNDFVKKYLPEKEIFITTDLALALPYKRKKNMSRKCRVGINVSGLLWNGGFIKNNQFGLTVEYPKYIIGLIEKLIDLKYEVHIIPHVTEVCENSQDGDLKVTEYLKKEYPILNIAPTYTSPIDVKNYIASMDVFTGARMHSTVAAFSSYVPTVPFAYSRKFQGLYENIGYKYLINGKQLSTQEAIDTTILYINHRDDLENDVERCMQNVNRQLEAFESDLKNVVLEENKKGD